MPASRTAGLAAAFVTVIACTPAAAQSGDLPFWTGQPDSAGFAARTANRLAAAQKSQDRLVAVKGRRTVANTLVLYDQIVQQTDVAGREAALVSEVHPEIRVREAAERARQDVSAFLTELSLSRPLYDALRAIDLASADRETRFYVQKTLRAFRLVGVDRDDSTRARVRELRDRIVVLEQTFERNIRDDVDTVRAAPTELEGLPPDYIARHTPGPDGLVGITTDYPDAFPIFNYAKSDSLRRRLTLAFENRAWPQNLPVLDSLLATRNELATLLGFANWADYVTADKMIGNGRNASEFIDRVVAASGPAAAHEYTVLLERKRRDVPDATAVNRWERRYWSQVVQREQYDFDARQARRYFPYDRVEQGMLDVATRIFDVQFRRVEGVPVWHPSVRAFEMLEQGKVVGRFYFDMHPRPGKFNHAAMFAVRTGAIGRLPEAALVCNLPGGVPGDPGLMDPEDVRTVFHEFGHLIHHLVASHHRWVGISGITTEWDFVEAPSQMLEEWMRDPATLASFAKDYETGEPIPAALVARMDRATDFGKALGVRRQMVFARISLGLHDQPPGTVVPDTLVLATEARYEPFPPMPETHFEAGFGHLTGYSAVYYTYMWSLVIAKDQFSTFDRSRLMAPGVARRYREVVLAPGGSMPAADLLKSYLGRPFNFDAWRRWLDEEQAPPASAP
ncbi:MAG TPA: M3 family metallopeptidase [Gemmatimonadales bacterium]|nr:M3 family metallopeptidase [Gemmatimonadales bacterium]